MIAAAFRAAKVGEASARPVHHECQCFNRSLVRNHSLEQGYVGFPDHLPHPEDFCLVVDRVGWSTRGTPRRERMHRAIAARQPPKTGTLLFATNRGFCDPDEEGFAFLRHSPVCSFVSVSLGRGRDAFYT
jgi:hypothetical protein